MLSRATTCWEFSESTNFYFESESYTGTFCKKDFFVPFRLCIGRFLNVNCIFEQWSGFILGLRRDYTFFIVKSFEKVGH